MNIASLVLPVFAVILTGWIAGALGYLPRALSGHIVQFAYNVAMPALVFLTIAQSPFAALLDWRFLVAFGGGSVLVFAVVYAVSHVAAGARMASAAMAGTAASMTNTGFVALPILQALYGAAGVVPAAIATMFIAIVLFPLTILLLEADIGQRGRAAILLRALLVNPVMISTVAGLVWSLGGLPLPKPVETYARIFADALTPCALFAIGLGLSLDDVRGLVGKAALLTAVKLVVLPLLVLGLSVLLGLDPFYTVAAVICSAVPTAKTAYMLAGEYRIEEAMVASTISITTLLSVVTLLGWLYALV
jgi:malonate transporter and related proteins